MMGCGRASVGASVGGGCEFACEEPVGGGAFGLGESRDRCGGRMIGGVSAGNWVGWAWSLGRGGRDGEGGGGRNFRPDGRWKEGQRFAVIVLELKFIVVKHAYRHHRRLSL